jgi:hypothetical protein
MIKRMMAGLAGLTALAALTLTPAASAAPVHYGATVHVVSQSRAADVYEVEFHFPSAVHPEGIITLCRMTIPAPYMPHGKAYRSVEVNSFAVCTSPVDSLTLTGAIYHVKLQDTSIKDDWGVDFDSLNGATKAPATDLYMDMNHRCESTTNEWVYHGEVIMAGTDDGVSEQTPITWGANSIEFC